MDKKRYLRVEEVMGDGLIGRWKNEGGAIDFFRRKILSQWNAPEYCVFDTLYHFDDDEFAALPESVQSLFCGELRVFLDCFMNGYQFVLYVSLLIYCVSMLFHKSPIENHIMMIAIIGGFLFSMMWEAILPYLIFSLPVAAMGIYKAQDLGMCLGKSIKSYFFGKRNNKNKDEEI